MSLSKKTLASHENHAFADDEVNTFNFPHPPTAFLPRVTLEKEKVGTTENYGTNPYQGQTAFPTADAEKKDQLEKGDALDGDEEDPGDSRITWDKPIEFLMSCISMSVGLGNVWRFPGVAARNGGGAFLIPYLIVLFLIGRPLYYLEMCLGQFSRYGQVKVWNMAPIFKGVGYGSMIGSVCFGSYYVFLMAIITYFLIVSFSKTLPWTECHEDKLPEDMTCEDIAGNEATAYYNFVVFPQVQTVNDGLGDMNWKLVGTLCASWILIFLCLIRGLKSSGKVAYFTAVFPYVVLIILFIRGVTLPGAGTGVQKFFQPVWKDILKPEVWYAAVEQCFFSLSAGFGAVIMFSSYNNFRQNIYRDAMIISVMDTFTSLLAGVTTFAVMGNLVETTDITFDDIGGGPALAFILYPQAIAKFGWAPQFFAVLFFLMLFTLGIGSATSLVNSLVTIVCDQFATWNRILVTFVVCVLGCLAGLVYVNEGGMFMLDLIDHYGAGFIIYVMVALETSGVCYVYGLRNICNDFEFMLGRSVGIYWKICWAFVLPIGLTANLLYYLIKNPTFDSSGVPYPTIATALGWTLTGLAVGLVPAWGLHAILTRKANTFGEKFLLALKPTSRWGPQKPSLRREWLQFREDKDSAKRKFLGIF